MGFNSAFKGLILGMFLASLSHCESLSW